MFASRPPVHSTATSLESTASVGGFLLYAESELHFSRESLNKYHSTLMQLERGLAGAPLSALTREDLYRIKARFIRDGLSDAWLASTLLSLKRYLMYIRDVEGAVVALDPAQIIPPRRKAREVVFLTPNEVERLVGAIRLRNTDGRVSLRGYRLRALVEMLLGSGVRISELLSIDRGQINLEAKETKIVGKGGRERTVFFTDRCLDWLSQYQALRDDSCPALFADLFGRHRMKRTDIWRYFARLRKDAGIEKRVTPHILRHTAATQLLFNGCPMAHIKEILGHSRLETTCRYYLGVDHRAAKQAHTTYLRY